MFVQFGEKLRHKRFDPNNLKTRHLDFSKPKQTVINQTTNCLAFVKFGEKLCSKRHGTNDLKNTLFELLKA